MGGSDNVSHMEIVTPSTSNSSKNVLRVRQYPLNHKGPFEVLIRKDNEIMMPIKVCAYIHKQYQGQIIQTKVVNTDKIRVECKDLETANKIPNDKNLCKKFKVYIPEIRCEVLGMIKLTIYEDENDLLNGFGKWKNPNIPEVKVLEVFRYTKKPVGGIEVENSQEQLKTESVRVAFPGAILPDYININGLLIGVREFKRNQLFCTKCQSYNHSEKYCQNKEKCKFCGSLQHKKENCEHKDSIKCVDCDGSHEPGSKDCLKRKYLENKQFVREKFLRKKTFAEMLCELTNDNADSGTKNLENVELPNETTEDEATDEDFQSTSKYIPGVKRQRWRSKAQLTQNKKVKAHETSDWPPIFKKPADPQRKTKPVVGPPPGFKKHDAETEAENDPIYMFLLSIVQKFEISQMLKDLIVKYLLPIAMQIISTIKNSISSSMMTGLISNVV